MTDRKPPFRADIVGSFLRPERLKEARRQAGLELDSTADDQSASTLSMEELRAIEDECIRELVAFEESIGLKVVTDGEFRRGSWAYDAIGRFEGIDLRRQDGSYGATFVSGFQPPIAHAEGKVGRKPGGIVLEDYKFTSSLTDRVVKATMPSPTLMFVRGGRDAVNKEVYPDLEEFFDDLTQAYRDEIADLSAAGATYVQIDNTDAALLCDPKFQEASRRKGLEPEDQIRLQGKLVSAATRGRPDNMTVSMHMCRGNSAGAMRFMNDFSLSLMGHRRGGPAKVAVIASSAFGSISGSAVANIMSTGVVTIPMMKEIGFQPKYAAAIEAVASNGGQIAPPVMGATAFIIAEFLEIAYAEVALAALLPAILYFLVLFMQVDGIAVRFGIKGLPKESLPKALEVLKSGWVYLVPLGVLIYFLIGLGYRAGLAGMYACGILLVLMIFKNRRLPNREEWRGFFVGGGENLVPLIMIGAGAGVIIGLMNSTGLGFQLSLVLTEVGQAAGIFVMLLLTAFICIVLGMGMPTAAVYVVLVSIIAPALVEMKIPELSAHMFIFYYGLLSMLTPPVAIASMVAAQMAGSDMWKTGLVGLQLAAAAFLLPFLWAFNPALLGQGTWLEISLVATSCVVGGLLIGQTTMVMGRSALGTLAGYALLTAAIAVGSATVWIGKADLMTLIPSAVGLIVVYSLRLRLRPEAVPDQR